MANLQTLFDLHKLEKRKIPEQQEFEEKNLDILMGFKNFVPIAFKRLTVEILSVIEPESQDKNLRATVVHGYLQGYFKKHFPLYCGHATSQRFCLNKGSEWLYIKKLNDKKRPANIPTLSSEIILNQLTSSKKDEAPNIFLGYTVSDDWQLTGTYAVCIEGDKIIWVTDLSNLADNNQTSIIHINPKTPTAPQIAEKVRVRKKGA